MDYRGLMLLINGANGFKIVNYMTRFLDKFGNDKLVKDFPAKRNNVI
jgi:phage regulator Rha-like protein